MLLGAALVALKFPARERERALLAEYASLDGGAGAGPAPPPAPAPGQALQPG